jgi:hypothetical protein
MLKPIATLISILFLNCGAIASDNNLARLDPQHDEESQQESFVLVEFDILQRHLAKLTSTTFSDDEIDVPYGILLGLIQRLNCTATFASVNFPDNFRDIFYSTAATQWHALRLSFLAFKNLPAITRVQRLHAIHPQIKAMIALQKINRFNKNYEKYFSTLTSSFLVSDLTNAQQLKELIRESSSLDFRNQVIFFSAAITKIINFHPRQFIDHPESEIALLLTKWARKLQFNAHLELNKQVDKSSAFYEAAEAQLKAINLSQIERYPAHILVIAHLQLQSFLLLVDFNQ